MGAAPLLLSVFQVVASKNSLVGLDEEASSSGSRRREVADAVVRALTPYYRKKRVASKVRSLAVLSMGTHTNSCKTYLHVLLGIVYS